MYSIENAVLLVLCCLKHSTACATQENMCIETRLIVIELLVVSLKGMLLIRESVW